MRAVVKRARPVVSPFELLPFSPPLRKSGRLPPLMHLPVSPSAADSKLRLKPQEKQRSALGGDPYLQVRHELSQIQSRIS